MSYKNLWLVIAVLLVQCGESSDDAIMIRSLRQAVYTGPALKLPLPTGYKWKIVTEAKTGNCGTDCIDRYHQDQYAIDFARHAKDNHNTSQLFNDGEIDILAAADGTVGKVVSSGCVPDPGCKGSFDLTCRVTINHAGDYSTRYLHFTNGTIMVHEGDHVVQGQVLGKMGTTGCSSGPHLHFDVYHKRNSATSNSNLDGLTLDGLHFINDYKQGSFISSTNGFTFPASADNPVTCSNEPVGGSPCTSETSFNIGQPVWPNLRLTNLTRDICFKIEFYLGDVKKAESSEWCSNTIETDGGWAEAKLWGSMIPTEAGTTWNARYFVRLKNGGAQYLPSPKAMAITSNFSVRSAPIPSPPTLIFPISTPAFPPTTKVSASPITLQWTSSAGASFYNVLFFIWNGTEWKQAGLWAITGSPIVVAGVPASTYCAWTTQACNGSSCSSWSDLGYFQTLP